MDSLFVGISYFLRSVKIFFLDINFSPAKIESTETDVKVKHERGNTGQ